MAGDNQPQQPNFSTVARTVEELTKEASLICQNLFQIADNCDHSFIANPIDRQSVRLGVLSQRLGGVRKDLSLVNEEIAAKFEEHERRQADLLKSNNNYSEGLAQSERENQSLKRQLNSQSPHPIVRPKVSFAKETKPVHKAPPSSEQIDPFPEYVARVALEDGLKDFESRRYHAARDRFRMARQSIHQLPSHAGANFNICDVEYHLAVCEAYSEEVDINTRKEILKTFLDSFGNHARIKPLQKAHAQHLLSQAHIQSGHLDEALKCSGEAFALQLKFVDNDDRRHESTALLARIYELQGNESMAQSINNRIPEDSRYRFRTKYARLHLGGTIDKTSGPVQPDPPSSLQRAPSWTFPQMQQGPAAADKEDSHIPSMLPARLIDKKTRQNWLKELDLHSYLADFEDAIVKSDFLRVQDLLHRKKDSRKALHVAALFGEVEIATLLLDNGRKVGELCRVRSEKHGHHYYSYYVSPLHLAIGAHNHAMIHLLDKYNASFGIFTPPKDADQSKKPCAPPRWMLSRPLLKLTGNEDPLIIERTVDTLLSLEKPWNINAPLNGKGETVLDVAMKQWNDHPSFRSEVIDHLKKHGAKMKKQLSRI